MYIVIWYYHDIFYDYIQHAYARTYNISTGIVIIEYYNNIIMIYVVI